MLHAQMGHTQVITKGKRGVLAGSPSVIIPWPRLTKKGELQKNLMCKVNELFFRGDIVEHDLDGLQHHRQKKSQTTFFLLLQQAPCKVLQNP